MPLLCEGQTLRAHATRRCAHLVILAVKDCSEAMIILRGAVIIALVQSQILQESWGVNDRRTEFLARSSLDCATIPEFF